MEYFKEKQKGFTVIELLITIGIMSLIAMVAVPSYFKYRNRVLVEREGSRMVEYLREGLARGRSQQGGVTWAINISNGTDDYYELLSGGATGTSVGKVYLSPGVAFTATTTATSTRTITGGSTITPISSSINVGLISSDGSLREEITVNTNGKITRTKNY